MDKTYKAEVSDAINSARNARRVQKQTRSKKLRVLGIFSLPESTYSKVRINAGLTGRSWFLPGRRK